MDPSASRNWKSEKAGLSRDASLHTRVLEDHLPHGAKLALLILALGLSVFLVALDNTIIATAIPKITDEFASLDDVGWYGSAYLLATAATQLLFGKFYTFLSIKWVYVSAIGFFEVGSVLCGAAPTSTVFILGRAVAGVGNAGIFSGALVIMANTVPLSKRPIYTGIVAGMAGIASVAGPLLGGVFADKLSWRWSFWINLPPGIATLGIVIIWLKLPPTGTPPPMRFLQRLSSFDPWGTLVFLPAIVTLLLGLQFGGSKYSWTSAPVIALLVVSGVLLTLFVIVQLRTQDQATVPPRILCQRSIWSSALFAFCMGAAFNIVIFYLPIWSQAIRGVSAERSGILILPMIGAYVLGCVLAGVLVPLVGFPAPAMILSGILAVLGTGMLTTLKSTSSQTNPLPFEILTGLGVGLGMQQPILAAQAALELKDIAVGTAILMFAQTLGGALFVSIGQVTFTTTLAATLVQKKVPGVDPAVILSAGATSLKSAVNPVFLEDVLFAYNQGLRSAFIVAVVVAGVALIGAFMVEWRSIKEKSVDMVSTA
ncbi:major facilitator superfamily domain-containing protein [Mycena rebaudengoi]|nr:major facilitator superfamily domain-containing protein [Mycena rebaudengoi]